MRLYQAVEAVPSRIMGILRVLHESEGRRRPADVLLELVQPRSVRTKEDADSLATNSLVLLRQLSSGEVQFIEESEDEGGRAYVTLGESLRSVPRRRFEDVVWERLEQVALAPQIGGQVNEFAQFCAWLMWQSPSSMPQTHLNLKSRMEAEGLNCDVLGLNSNARWDVAMYWANYFGLIWQWKDVKCEGLVPDPTEYLRRVLDDLIPARETVAAADLVDALGRRCPVLDGGAVHTTVGETIRASKGEVRSGRLSPALSLAIRSLADLGELRHWCPDDQRTFLLFSNGEKIAFLQRNAAGRRG